MPGSHTLLDEPSQDTLLSSPLLDSLYWMVAAADRISRRSSLQYQRSPSWSAPRSPDQEDELGQRADRTASISPALSATHDRGDPHSATTTSSEIQYSTRSSTFSALTSTPRPASWNTGRTHNAYQRRRSEDALSGTSGTVTRSSTRRPIPVRSRSAASLISAHHTFGDRAAVVSTPGHHGNERSSPAQGSHSTGPLTELISGKEQKGDVSLALSFSESPPQRSSSQGARSTSPSLRNQESNDTLSFGRSSSANLHPILEASFGNQSEELSSYASIGSAITSAVAYGLAMPAPMQTSPTSIPSTSYNWRRWSNSPNQLDTSNEDSGRNSQLSHHSRTSSAGGFKPKELILANASAGGISGFSSPRSRIATPLSSRRGSVVAFSNPTSPTYPPTLGRVSPVSPLTIPAESGIITGADTFATISVLPSSAAAETTETRTFRLNAVVSAGATTKRSPPSPLANELVFEDRRLVWNNSRQGSGSEDNDTRSIKYMTMASRLLSKEGDKMKQSASHPETDPDRSSLGLGLVSIRAQKGSTESPESDRTNETQGTQDRSVSTTHSALTHKSSSTDFELVPWQVATHSSEESRSSAEEIFRPLSSIMSRQPSGDTDSTLRQSAFLPKTPLTPLKHPTENPRWSRGGKDYFSFSTSSSHNPTPERRSVTGKVGLGISIPSSSGPSDTKEQPYPNGAGENEEIEQILDRDETGDNASASVSSPPGGMHRLLKELERASVDSHLSQTMFTSHPTSSGSEVDMRARKGSGSTVDTRVEARLSRPRILPRTTSIGSKKHRPRPRLGSHSLPDSQQSVNREDPDQPSNAQGSGGTSEPAVNMLEKDAEPIQKHKRLDRRISKFRAAAVACLVVYEALFFVFSAPYLWSALHSAVPLVAALLYLGLDLMAVCIVMLDNTRNRKRWSLAFVVACIPTTAYCMVFCMLQIVKMSLSPDRGASAPGIHLHRARHSHGNTVAQVLRDVPFAAVLFGLGCLILPSLVFWAIWIACLSPKRHSSENADAHNGTA